ncbi:MAG: hypothetical protein ACRCXT_17235 [Paraclostridium sp.]
MKTLTENLKVWRKERNISKADYLVFVGNILEELLEPIYEKVAVDDIKTKILNQYFSYTDEFEWNKNDIIDAIQDIQVFCINETELMGYDNIKCNNEVFKEINSRKQDPEQAIAWAVIGAIGKWQKMKDQPKETLYVANYSKCKL